MTALLRLEGVHKNFGALRVADGIDLDAAANEALGIIGPNGAGKSTLFNLVTGTVPVTSGRILFDGQDVTGLPPSTRCRAGIARSFQIPHPFSGMSVYENLLVASMFGDTGSSRAHIEHCAEILERTGLLPKADLPASQLTLLERKRLELARALATRPRLLLLDEIAGGLTHAECVALISTIKEIHAAGVTIVWIEHVVHALISVVSRLILLHGGKLTADGAPADVMADSRVREVYLGIGGHDKQAA
jgi:branched-chain amino acid transport system ATP-binding protein